MGRKVPKILTEDEQSRLLRQFNTRWLTPHRNLCMTRLMLEVGLRAGEVTALKREHLDLMSCRLMVRDGKGSKDRTLWIREDLKEEIANYLQKAPESQYLFPTKSGKKVDTRYLRRMTKRMARKAGVSELDRVSPHTFRHTFASNLLDETGNLELVRKALGHADLQTTQIYLHVVDQQLEDALRRAPSAVAP